MKSHQALHIVHKWLLCYYVRWKILKPFQDTMMPQGYMFICCHNAAMHHRHQWVYFYASPLLQLWGIVHVCVCVVCLAGNHPFVRLERDLLSPDPKNLTQASSIPLE